MHGLVLYLHRQKQSPEVFCKKGVHRNFAKFTKYSCARDSFLIKLHLRDATLLKKSPCHWCFSVNFEKFLRTPFFKTPLDDCFYKELNGCKIAFTGRSSNRTCSVRKSVLRNSGQQLYQKSDSGTGVFLWILRNCSEHLFYWTPLGDDFCNGELAQLLTNNWSIIPALKKLSKRISKICPRFSHLLCLYRKTLQKFCHKTSKNV